MTLDQIRHAIDKLDMHLLEVLKKRQELVISAARYKDCLEGETGVIVPSRIAKVLKNVEQKAGELGIDQEFARKLYQSIIDHMIQLEIEKWGKDDSNSTP